MSEFKNAKDFYESLETNINFTKLTSAGISTDYNNIFEFADAYYNAQMQANQVDESVNTLPIDSVMPRFSVSLVYQNVKSTMLRTLILNAKDKANAMLESIEYFKEETDGMGLLLNTVIELNDV